jgi:hypothetical protein
MGDTTIIKEVLLRFGRRLTTYKEFWLYAKSNSSNYELEVLKERLSEVFWNFEKGCGIMWEVTYEI